MATVCLSLCDAQMHPMKKASGRALKAGSPVEVSFKILTRWRRLSPGVNTIRPASMLASRVSPARMRISRPRSISVKGCYVKNPFGCAVCYCRVIRSRRPAASQHIVA